MSYIYKRDKYWWIGYYEGTKPIQKSLKVTSKRAAELLSAEYQLLEAKYRHNSKLIIIKKKIEDIYNEFIEKRTFRKRTKEFHEWGKKYLLTFFQKEGIEYVGQISLDIIEKFYTERRKEAPGGARSNIYSLKTMLNYAITKNYINENPVKKLKVEKPDKKIFRDLSFSETIKFLKEAEKHGPSYYPFYATAYYVGLRMGELIYLSPDDVSYEEKCVYVRSKEEHRIKDKQERKIPLNNKLAEILKRLDHKGKYLFCTKDGRPRINNLNREIKRIGKIAGIKGMSVQILRETFGSHLRRKGVDIALIKDYMGHSSIDVTLRHYAHIPIGETHDKINLL